MVLVYFAWLCCVDLLMMIFVLWVVFLLFVYCVWFGDLLLIVGYLLIYVERFAFGCLLLLWSCDEG